MSFCTFYMLLLDAMIWYKYLLVTLCLFSLQQLHCTIAFFFFFTHLTVDLSVLTAHIHYCQMWPKSVLHLNATRMHISTSFSRDLQTTKTKIILFLRHSMYCIIGETNTVRYMRWYLTPVSQFALEVFEQSISCKVREWERTRWWSFAAFPYCLQHHFPLQHKSC